MEIISLLAGLYESIDPDMDVLTAANSWNSVTKPEQDIFVNSWQAVPVAGEIISCLGLPGTLTALVIFATFTQLSASIVIHQRLWRLIEQLPTADVDDEPYFRWKLWVEFAHLADIAGLMALKDAFHALIRVDLASGHPDVWPIIDRVASFRVKVLCEAVPNLWFQISLLALTFNTTGIQSQILTLVSIFTGMLTIIGQTMLELKTLLAGLHRFDDRRFKLKSFLIDSFCSILTVCCLVASCVRLFGVWLCPSHIFNFTTNCMPLT